MIFIYKEFIPSDILIDNICHLLRNYYIETISNN
jgi:hypothetical protein